MAKTCGTCAHGKPALVKCAIHRDEFPWLKKQKDTCADWTERADSVDQVAREMLFELTMIGAFTPDSAKEAVADMHVKNFRLRLRELGVVE